MPLRVDKAAESKALRVLGLKATDQVVAAFVSHLLDSMPVEDGHGHEAFSTAIEQVVQESGGTSLRDTSQVLQEHQAHRSNDPEAKKRGEGIFAVSDDFVYVELSAGLPFLQTLEAGGTIRPGDLEGNRGRKASPDTHGQLYASRLPGTTGLLAWRDSAGFHMAKKRVVSGLKFFQKSASAARQRARQLGLRKVK